MARDDDIQSNLIRAGSVVRVLLIDDQPVTRRMMLRMLEGAPEIELHYCRDPFQALAMADKCRPAVILLDLIMPKMDGLTLLRRFRGQPATQQTPIVILSVDDRPEIKARLFAEGANDYLVKLPDKLELIARLRYHATYKTLIDQYNRDLSEYEARRNAILQNTGDGVISFDEYGRIESFNAAAARIFGYAIEEMLGQSVTRLLTDPHAALPAAEVHQFLAERVQRWLGQAHETDLRRQDGTRVPVSVTLTREPLLHLILFTAIVRDLTERQKMEEKLRLQAEYDSLTGLPNRSLFQDRLTQGLAQAKRLHSEVVLMFIDLDRFKEINDTLGHDVGDQLLVEAARRLKQAVRETDTVARLGGDEFTVIINGLTHPCYVELVSRVILENLSRPFELDGRVLTISCSIGITLFPHDGQETQVLLKNADTAMYQAKAMGRNAFRFFTPQMNEEMQERAKLIQDLRVAVERAEFELYYQPIIDPHQGRVVGAEALLRWRHPTQGLVMPGRFISLTEETGLILDIGRWALREACRQVKAWQADEGFPPLRVTVNISPRQVELVEELVSRFLDETGLDPLHLGIELTESMLIDGEEAVVESMRALRARGVQLYVDDFGTGYSSLSYLQKFPVSVVKIDRSFIYRLQERESDRAIVEAIIAMAHCLNLQVVAEGVETVEQARLLKNWKCNLLQGYHYAQPLPAAEFLAFGQRCGWRVASL